MSKKKRRRSTKRGTLSFVRNLTAGNDNPVERARRIAGNVMRRNWFGRRRACCGNYGDPGC